MDYTMFFFFLMFKLTILLAFLHQWFDKIMAFQHVFLILRNNIGY